MAWLLIPTTWKLATKSSFEEFHAPIWQASLHVTDLSYFWGHLSDSKKTLIEKGRDHQRILSDLNNQLNTTEDLKGNSESPEFKAANSRIGKFPQS